MKIYFGTNPESSSMGAKKIFVYTSMNKMPYELRNYLEEFKASVDGFNWGYTGSGPAQLAYAILRDFLNDVYAPNDIASITDKKSQEISEKAYQMFKVHIISRIDQYGPFCLPSEVINSWWIQNKSNFKV